MKNLKERERSTFLDLLSHTLILLFCFFLIYALVFIVCDNDNAHLPALAEFQPICTSVIIPLWIQSHSYWHYGSEKVVLELFPRYTKRLTAGAKELRRLTTDTLSDTLDRAMMHGTDFDSPFEEYEAIHPLDHEAPKTSSSLENDPVEGTERITSQSSTNRENRAPRFDSVAAKQSIDSQSVEHTPIIEVSSKSLSENPMPTSISLRNEYSESILESSSVDESLAAKSDRKESSSTSSPVAESSSSSSSAKASTVKKESSSTVSVASAVKKESSIAPSKSSSTRVSTSALVSTFQSSQKASSSSRVPPGVKVPSSFTKVGTQAIKEEISEQPSLSSVDQNDLHTVNESEDIADEYADEKGASDSLSQTASLLDNSEVAETDFESSPIAQLSPVLDADDVFNSEDIPSVTFSAPHPESDHVVPSLAEEEESAIEETVTEKSGMYQFYEK